MKTFDQLHDDCNHSGHSCSYSGERGAWLIAVGQHRNSDALERSNFRSFLRMMGGEGDTIAIERESHWAVGWVEHLLIDPTDAQRVQAAEAILADYPIVDEKDFSHLENDDFQWLAEWELQRFAGWAEALGETRQESEFDSAGGSGDETADWKLIEETRRRLEQRDLAESF